MKTFDYSKLNCTIDNEILGYIAKIHEYKGKQQLYTKQKKDKLEKLLIWIVAIYLGAVLNLTLVWNIADSMNALMAIPNLVSLLLLSGVAAKETKKYLWENRLDEEAKEEF